MSGKRLRLLVLAAFLSSGSASRAVPPTGDPQVRLQVIELPQQGRLNAPPPTSTNAGWAETLREEVPRLAAHPGHAFRLWHRLALRLENGRFAILSDEMAADVWDADGQIQCCEVSYRFRDFWPDLGFYAVEAHIHFGDEGLLVSSRTAEVTTIRGVPFRVPQNPALIVSVLTSDQIGHGLEVWRLQDGRWHRTQDCPRMPYGTEFVRWDDEGRLFLRRLSEAGAWVEEPFALQANRLLLPAC